MPAYKNIPRHLISVFLLSLACLLPTQVEARIKYGLWEITVQVQLDGTPVDTPSETFQKCITRKDLTPGDNQDKEGCEKDKVKRDGDTVNWTVNCSKDKHTMRGSGMVIYTDNTMTGNAQFQAGGKGLASMKMRLNYKGRHIGRCSDKKK